jgi:hypothetical protein
VPSSPGVGEGKRTDWRLHTNLYTFIVILIAIKLGVRAEWPKRIEDPLAIVEKPILAEQVAMVPAQGCELFEQYRVSQLPTRCAQRDAL